MADLTINQGVTSLGNYSSADIPLSNVDSNVNSIKTLVNGQWKSWTKSTPDAFQGILNIEKGRGFVTNSTATALLPINDELVDINTVNITNGLNFLCFPYVDKPVINGYLPRTRSNSIKTLTTTWKSWTIGAPDAFQGFTNVNKNSGYVCNINDIYDVYLDNNKRDNNTGVRIGTDYINALTNVSTNSQVEFISDAIYKSISYDEVAVNPITPLNNLWIKINNTVKLIKYPTELSDTRFSIKEMNVDSLNYGSITDSITASLDYGSITDTTTIDNKDLGNLTSGYGISNIVYTGMFTPNVNNSESNPLIISDMMNFNAVELMYDALTISTTPVYNKMYFIVDNIKMVVEFTTEYLGKDFIILKNNKEFNLVFNNTNTFTSI